MGPVRLLRAVCNAVASADASDVTVSRDVPDDVEVGSLVGGLLQRGVTFLHQLIDARVHARAFSLSISIINRTAKGS